MLSIEIAEKLVNIYDINYCRREEIIAAIVLAEDLKNIQEQEKKK